MDVRDSEEEQKVVSVFSRRGVSLGTLASYNCALPDGTYLCSNICFHLNHRNLNAYTPSIAGHGIGTAESGIGTGAPQALRRAGGVPPPIKTPYSVCHGKWLTKRNESMTKN